MERGGSQYLSFFFFSLISSAKGPGKIIKEDDKVYNAFLNFHLVKLGLYG